MSGTELRSTDLSGANARSAILCGANLSGTRLHDRTADFGGMVFEHERQIFVNRVNPGIDGSQQVVGGHPVLH